MLHSDYQKGFIDCNEKMIGMENADINTIVITICVSHIGSVFIITNSHRFKLYRSNRIESTAEVRNLELQVSKSDHISVRIYASCKILL
jgi:hypothetical protein